MATAGTNMSRRARRRISTTTIATATMPTMIDSSRLPNSMPPWMPISGVATREASVQSGHVGHPSPDDVRRTAPPVPTMRTWVTRVSQDSTRTVRSTDAGSRFQNLRRMPGEGAVVPVTFASLSSDPRPAFRFPGSPG